MITEVNGINISEARLKLELQQKVKKPVILKKKKT